MCALEIYNSNNDKSSYFPRICGIATEDELITLIESGGKEFVSRFEIHQALDGFFLIRKETGEELRVYSGEHYINNKFTDYFSEIGVELRGSTIFFENGSRLKALHYSQDENGL